MTLGTCLLPANDLARSTPGPLGRAGAWNRSETPTKDTCGRELRAPPPATALPSPALLAPFPWHRPPHRPPSLLFPPLLLGLSGLGFNVCGGEHGPVFLVTSTCTIEGFSVLLPGPFGGSRQSQGGLRSGFPEGPGELPRAGATGRPRRNAHGGTFCGFVRLSF